MLKIKEAIAFQNAFRKRTGKNKLTAGKLAVIMFPGLNTAQQKMTRINSGKEKVSSEEVQKICEQCEVDPNFLFGYETKTKSFESDQK